MVDMIHLHQYVPTVQFTEEDISTGEKIVHKARIHPILGGDQLTAARSAIKAKVNAETPSKDLKVSFQWLKTAGAAEPIRQVRRLPDQSK